MSSFINRLRFRSASNARSKETPVVQSNAAPQLQNNAPPEQQVQKKRSFISTATSKLGQPNRPPLPSANNVNKQKPMPPKIITRQSSPTNNTPNTQSKLAKFMSNPQITKVTTQSDLKKEQTPRRLASPEVQASNKKNINAKQIQKKRSEEKKKDASSENDSSSEEQSSSTSKENRNELNNNYFSAYNQEIEACLAQKQMRKVKFLQTQNDQLTAQVKDLQAILTKNQSQSEVKAGTNDLLIRLSKERDEAQAQVLVMSQIIENTKQEEADTRRELAVELEELKDKMDRTEFIIQYKEEIWTALEAEIRKVVSKDSNLMRKIESKTRILTDCLAQNKVSTVAKQNAVLTSEHDQALDVLLSLKTSLEQTLSQSQYQKREHKQEEQNDTSILCLTHSLNLLCKQLQDRNSLLEEDNTYFKQQIKTLTKKQQSTIGSFQNDFKEQSTAISGAKIISQQQVLGLKPFLMQSEETAGGNGYQLPEDFQGKVSARGGQIDNMIMGGMADFDDDLRLSEIKPRKMSRYGRNTVGDLENDLDESWVQQSPFIDVDF